MKILPVFDSTLDYCYMISNIAKSKGLRASVDVSGNRLGKLIRNAEQEKVPIIAVIGKNELETETISIRLRGGQEIKNIKIEDVFKSITDIIDNNKDIIPDNFQ